MFEDDTYFERREGFNAAVDEVGFLYERLMTMLPDYMQEDMDMGDVRALAWEIIAICQV